MDDSDPRTPHTLAVGVCQFYYSFWDRFYTTAKYGLDGVDLGPERLFEQEEAQVALKHAKACRFAAKQLENFAKRTQPKYEMGQG